MREILICATLILCMGTVYGQFTEGVIVDQHGQSFPGFMKISKTDATGAQHIEQSETLIYKESAKGKKEELTVKDLSAFRMGEDSFLVLRDFQLPLENIRFNKFAKVLMKSPNGILCSFEETRYTRTRTTAYKEVITHYLVQREGKLTPVTEFNFQHEVPALVADNKSLHSKVQSKALTFRDIEAIADEFERSK